MKYKSSFFLHHPNMYVEQNKPEITVHYPVVTHWVSPKDGTWYFQFFLLNEFLCKATVSLYPKAHGAPVSLYMLFKIDFIIIH